MEKPNHLTHPWKVEAREPCGGPHYSRLVGRAMFKTKEEAEDFADNGIDSTGRVLRSTPGDEEFA